MDMRCDAVSDHNQWYFMKGTRQIVHIGQWTEECLGIRQQQVVICQCARYPGSGCSADEITWRRTKWGGLANRKSGICVQNTGGYLTAAKCVKEDLAFQWDIQDR